MKTWLKGGIWCACIFAGLIVIMFILMIVAFSGMYIWFGHGGSELNAPQGLQFAYYLSLLITFLFIKFIGFIVGSVIGWIVGKFKK